MSKLSESKELWAKTEPADNNHDVIEAFKIAADSCDFDMSVLCGIDQEYVGEEFHVALNDAEGELTDAVRLAVGKALVLVLASPHCEDFMVCEGGERLES